jgi:CRISPR-associated protein Csh2
MTDTTAADPDGTNVVSNRSEILFLYDAEDTNPNGNPLSANDKPRIDETTGAAVVTDVRLKRYLRDQLDDDDFGIYVKNPSKSDIEDVPGRDELFTRVTGLEEDELDEMGGNEAAVSFLQHAVDVRYFGATCSFSSEFQYGCAKERIKAALDGRLKQ